MILMKRRLLDQVPKKYIPQTYYSQKTEHSDIGWIERSIISHVKRLSLEIGGEEIRSGVTH